MTSIVAEAVARYLGGTAAPYRDVRSDLDLARLIEGGLAVGTVDHVLKEDLMASDELYEVVIPRRTLSKRRSTTGRLSIEESDRLVRVLRIMAIAEETFGNVEKASEWMRRSNRAMGGRRPLELLTTETGARLVETILGRIEYGVYS